MNPLKMVRDLHAELNAEFDLVIFQIEALEKIDDEFAPLHIAILSDKYDTLVNRIYLLEKAIKKYTRLSMTYSDDSFLGLIEKCSDPRYVEVFGRAAELEKMAADKIGDNLLDIHEYMDGTIDPVILNWESAERMKSNEEQDDKDKPTALEVAIERAYRKRDIPKFVKLIGKMMTLSDNKDGAGGAKLFQYALNKIQKTKDDLIDSTYEKEMAALIKERNEHD